MTCETCGLELAVGSWPFCPHGTYRGGVIGDDIPGGMVIENLQHEPLTFYSKKAIVKKADALGLQPMIRHVEGDKHLSNWATAIDPYTMAAAVELVKRRMARSRVDPPDDIQCETAAFTAREIVPHDPAA
jgi:hypothetical protein